MTTNLTTAAQIHQIPGGKFTLTVPHTAVALDIGMSGVWALIGEGKLETIAFGRRRLVVVDSIRRLIAQKLTEDPEDCRRNAAVPALGERPGKRGPGRPRKTPTETA